MSDYIFFNAIGQMLAIDAMDEYEAAEYAQVLAQEAGEVTYAEKVNTVQPIKCLCGQVLTVAYICPDCGRELER